MNEIVKRNKNELSEYGQDENILALVKRMRFMIPGAADAPDMKIWQAAQLALMHRLDPFSGDVWVYPAYKGCPPEQWIVDVGVSAWRRTAQGQAKYTTLFTELTPDECKRRIGDPWTPEDVGMRCTLYRLDIARECKDLGIPYEPVVAEGFWRRNAGQKRNGEWYSDTLANTETKADKAAKRAEKKALRKAFHLAFPGETALHEGWQVSEVADQVKSEERNRALPVNQDANPFGEFTPDESDKLQADLDAITIDSVPEIDFNAGVKEQSPAPIDDNPFDDETPIRVRDWLNTDEPVGQAKIWAIESTACSNQFEADNSIKKIVDAHGGRLTKANLVDVLTAFYFRQVEKLNEREREA